LKLPCVTCHQTVLQAATAGWPPVAQCRVCHVEMAEVKFPSAGRKRVVPDFVNFSHVRHKQAAKCESCHPVERVALKMKFCVDCHKSEKAATACNVCHELGQ